MHTLIHFFSTFNIFDPISLKPFSFNLTLRFSSNIAIRNFSRTKESTYYRVDFIFLIVKLATILVASFCWYEL
ncbi:hypothetical protein Hanom_Chr14g01265761 [Helianthus anomalus]